MCVFTGVVEYLMAGKVPASHEDFKGIAYDDSLSKLTSSETKDMFTHDFKLGAAYDKECVPFTNYTYVLLEI